MSLHDRIKEARIRKGLTQEQLGELIGVAKTTITGYEKNREPTAAKVGEIADALDVDANFLFQDEVKILHANHASLIEMEIIKRYRDLDDHGKEMVDMVLDKEHARVTAKVVPLSRPSTIAAHFEGDEFTEDELDEIREFTDSVKNKEK